MNVEVCRRKCKFMEECKSYEKYIRTTALEEPGLGVESHATAVSPNEPAGEEVHAA